MHLLRFRPTTRDQRIFLPDGTSKLVKVIVNDAQSTQHVHDTDGRVHGTGRPPAVRVSFRKPGRNGLLRNMGMPRIRQAFTRDAPEGLWAPIPGSEELLP